MGCRLTAFVISVVLRCSQLGSQVNYYHPKKEIEGKSYELEIGRSMQRLRVQKRWNARSVWD